MVRNAIRIAALLALISAAPAFAQQKTPAQLTQATSIANGDLLLVWPSASNGPLKSVQWSVAESLMQAALGNQYLQVNNNLSDVASPSISRANLGLGGAAVLNVGQVTGTVMAGDDSRVAGACQTTGCAFTGAVSGTSLTLADGSAASINTFVVSEPSNSDGANIELIGNGIATPAKFIRVAGGSLQIMSNGYGSIFNLTDIGNLTLSGSVSVVGVTSTGSVANNFTYYTGFGAAPVAGRGNVQEAQSGISGGAPASSGSIDSNQFAALGNTSVALRLGLYGNGDVWLQPSLIGNYATNLNVVLVPNSGLVGIGKDPSLATLDVNGSIAASTNVSVGGTLSVTGNAAVGAGSTVGGNQAVSIGASASGAGSISYGTGAPPTLATNAIYLQTN